MKRFGLVALLGLAACSATPKVDESPLAVQASDRARWLRDARVAMAQHQYTLAIDLYDKVEAYFPTTPGVEQVILQNLYAHYRQGDSVGVHAMAEHYLQLYSHRPAAAYVHYMQAMAWMGETSAWQSWWGDPSKRDVAKFKQAQAAFKRLLVVAPHSPYADQARGYLWRIRSLLAQHELSIAKYYWHQGDDLAALARLRIVLVNYAGTQAERQALHLSEGIAKRLGLVDMAGRLAAVVRLNQGRPA